MGVFENLKRAYMKRLGIKTSTKQTDQVIRMYAWQTATLPRNIVSAFQCAGCTLIADGQMFYLQVSRSEATKVLHWESEPFPGIEMGGNMPSRLKIV
jgi:hypothetical protein